MVAHIVGQTLYFLYEGACFADSFVSGLVEPGSNPSLRLTQPYKGLVC